MLCETSATSSTNASMCSPTVILYGLSLIPCVCACASVCVCMCVCVCQVVPISCFATNHLPEMPSTSSSTLQRRIAPRLPRAYQVYKRPTNHILDIDVPKNSVIYSIINAARSLDELASVDHFPLPKNTAVNGRDDADAQIRAVLHPTPMKHPAVVGTALSARVSLKHIRRVIAEEASLAKQTHH